MYFKIRLGRKELRVQGFLVQVYNLEEENYGKKLTTLFKTSFVAFMSFNLKTYHY